MKARFLPAAELEFIKELAYYSKVRPGSGAKFEAAVEAATQMAMRHPNGGAPSFKTTRSFRVKGFPFSLVYRASESEILIVAIAPHSKAPNYWAVRVSSPGESHPQALSEPYVRLSPHTAPSVQPSRHPGDFALRPWLLPRRVGRAGLKLDHQRPFGPVPLQNLQPYYERFCPRAPHRYFGSRSFRHLSFSLRIGTTGSPVPHRSLIRVLAASMPGAGGALSRPIDGRPHLIPETSLFPGFDTVEVISTRHQRFTCVQLLEPHLTRSLPRLFHRRSPPGHCLPSSSWRFEGCSCAPPPGGPPPSSTKHRT